MNNQNEEVVIIETHKGMRFRIRKIKGKYLIDGQLRKLARGWREVES